MPTTLVDQIQNLETWAQDNKRDAKLDTFRFWMLKTPAILVSASSGIFAHFKLDAVAVITGAIASLCVLIDALNPGGALRNVHLRAFHDLRRLEETMTSNWKVGDLRDENRDLLAATIIEAAKKEKDRIAADIRNAETSLGVTSRGKHHAAYTP
jgi:hypothetical protein